MMHVYFVVPGPPHGKDRPRYNPRSGKHYTPHATRAYEAAILKAWLGVANQRIPWHAWGGRVWLSLVVYHRVLKSFPADAHEACEFGAIPCCEKPDFTNIAKCVEDALSGRAYRDDAQIVLRDCDKLWAPTPERVGIEVGLAYPGLVDFLRHRGDS